MDSLPLNEIKGNQVRLVPLTEADIDHRLPSWLNDPVVVRYSNQRFRVHTVDTCRQYLRGFEDSPNRYYLIPQIGNNQPIGTITAYVSMHHGTVDLGILIGERDVWGCGFGQDAWNTLQSAVLTIPSIRKVTGGTLSCNFGMIRIFENAGMHLEAVRQAQELVAGKPEDVIYYARFSDK